MKLTKMLARNFQIDVTNLAQLEQYEKMGWDVSEFKEPLLAQAKVQQAAREGKIAADDNALSNPVHLERLNPYLAVPRDPGCALIQDMLKIMLVGKKEKLKSYSAAPLVYASVVQANRNLWQPGTAQFLPAVLVFAADDAHRNDVAWLNNLAGEIKRLKNSAEIPQDMLQLIGMLRNDQSEFCYKIGASAAGGADAWCATYKFSSQSQLPGKCLPSIGIVPFLLKSPPVQGGSIGTNFVPIPAKFYN